MGKRSGLRYEHYRLRSGFTPAVDDNANNAGLTPFFPNLQKLLYMEYKKTDTLISMV